MLNYSKALRNDIGVWSKNFLYALLTAPLCEARMEIFSHCANTNFATLLLQIGGSPASLSTQHTLSFLFTLPFLCAFPHSLLYIPSAENRASNIRLELPTTWHKQTQKSRQNKLSHFCVICALISESKTLLLTNEKLCDFLHDIWWNFLQTKLIQLSPKACLALPGAILYMEKSSMRLIFTCLLVYWKWKHEWHAFLAAPLLTGSKLLHSSYFHACHQPVSTYFSYLSNRWELGDELYLVSQSAQTQAQSYYHRQRSPQICFVWP